MVFVQTHFIPLGQTTQLAWATNLRSQYIVEKCKLKKSVSVEFFVSH